MKRLAFIILAIICIASCQKAPELTITSSPTVELNVDGSSGTITFTANRAWTVSSSDSWVTISPSSGEASDKPVTVTVRCNANTTYDDRTATVTIRMEDLSQSVTIKQPANLGVVLPKQVFDLQADAKSIDVEVQANVQYTVSTSVDWIKQTGTKGLTSKTLTFSIEENKSYDSREGKITIKPQESGAQEQVISVRQAQKDALNVEKTSYDMPYGGGEIEIKVEANVSFDVTPNAEWIHYTQTKALSNSTVCLKIDENPTYSARKGTVEIKQKNGSLKHTITVNQAGRIAVTSIELNKNSLTLRPEESETLIATVKPDNATDKTVNWTTSNATVATVDNTGKVIAVEDGFATITAIAGEKEATCSVTVKKSKKYLTFRSKGNTDLTLVPLEGNEGSSPVLYYSYDLVTWEQWDYSSLSFSDTKPLYLYGENKDGFNRYANGHGSWSRFCAKGSEFECSGSIMSLINPDKDVVGIPSDHCFANLFSSCSLLVSAPELPATTLTEGCYFSMFYGCSSLLSAPELPATTLAWDCYHSMFRDCSSLKTAPRLSATELGIACYQEMFRGCSSIVSAPELPATSLANGCYVQMFEGCTSLLNAPELPAKTLAQGCYSGMFTLCNSLTTAPELPVTELVWSCYESMFSGCTSLTIAPELPATKLADNCYWRMFYGCTSLTTAPELPATTLTDGCYYKMFSHCTSLVNAPKLPATTLTHNCYAWMFELCKSLTTAPELPATILAEACYWGMFSSCRSLEYIKCLAIFDGNPGNSTNFWVQGVPSTGTFVKNPATTNWPSGINGIPNGWTVQDAE